MLFRDGTMPGMEDAEMPASRIEPIIRHVRTLALRQDVAGMTDGQLLDTFVGNHDAAAFEVLVFSPFLLLM